ncbi:MAG: SIMPL domain-containing protein [Patescibacteria group bacterium]
MKLFESARIEKLAALFLLVAALLVAFQAIGALKGLFEPRAAYGNVITVEGVGKVTAIPDIARVSFSVNEEADTAADAQEMAAEKINAALDLLKGELGIEEKDIKTTSYNISPKYSYPRPCYSGFCPEIQYEQTIIGYTASQSIEVKIRDTKTVGDVLVALGGVGIENLSGPSFTIDDPEALKAEAREEAIEQARTKAKELAKDLNVRLVRVTGFWENTGGYYPYAEKAYGLGGDMAVSSVAPELPLGESEVQVNVSVTYEIR